ncbi:hypothetical protein DXG01_009336 [Tephrocybe rancida]|nr:hypothetical protein DXG01_009336 [Tephrocybe rancida]
MALPLSKPLRPTPKDYPQHRSSQPTASSSPKELTPRAIVGITVSMLVIGSILAGSLVFFYRRKQRRSRRRPARDIIPVSSPTYDKSFIPGPFLTDIQAKGLGFDATEQPTRRIEAKFLPIDYRTSSEAKKTDDADPHVPRILVTGDGDTSGRSITPSSSGHHRPHSLTGHTPSIQYSLDVKSSLNSRGSSPDTLGEGPSSAAPAAPVETEITHRMRDLLEQMEHNVTAPAAEPGIAMVQLQRRVEILQRENQELREDIAPPAYEGNGRF